MVSIFSLERDKEQLIIGARAIRARLTIRWKSGIFWSTYHSIHAAGSIISAIARREMPARLAVIFTVSPASHFQDIASRHNTALFALVISVARWRAGHYYFDWRHTAWVALNRRPHLYWKSSPRFGNTSIFIARRLAVRRQVLRYCVCRRMMVMQVRRFQAALLLIRGVEDYQSI